MIDIIFVIDESSSMNPYVSHYIKGINYLLDTQKRINPTSRFSLIKFNSHVNIVCKDAPISTLEEFNTTHYNPNGLTALYDAIGAAIGLKYTYSESDIITDTSNTIVFILTDGQDNRSSSFSLPKICEQIRHVTSLGWKFVYIAANQDAQTMGHHLGIETCVTYSQSQQSIERAMEVCNVAIGHVVSKISGLANLYTNTEIPSDVSDIMADFGNFSI